LGISISGDVYGFLNENQAWPSPLSVSVGDFSPQEFVSQPLDMELHALVCADIFNGPDRELGQQFLFYLLDAIIQGNEDFLRAYPDFPLLYNSPTRYVRDYDRLPKSVSYEEWKLIPSIVRRNWVADCKDLVAWRVAELRVRYGIMAKPTLLWKTLPNGKQVYHVQVRYPDGTIEDPSVNLGMTVAMNSNAQRLAA
jgi:hypothetical protein